MEAILEQWNRKPYGECRNVRRSRVPCFTFRLPAVIAPPSSMVCFLDRKAERKRSLLKIGINSSIEELHLRQLRQLCLTNQCWYSLSIKCWIMTGTMVDYGWVQMKNLMRKPWVYAAWIRKLRLRFERAWKKLQTVTFTVLYNTILSCHDENV